MFFGFISLGIGEAIAQGSPDRHASYLPDLYGILDNSNLSLEQRIEKIESLRADFLQSYPHKDSIYAEISHRLASVYSDQYDYGKGIELLKESISINKTRLGQRPFLANSYYNTGLFYMLLGFGDEAISYFDSSLLISRKYPEKAFLSVWAYSQLGHLFAEHGDLQKCIEISDFGLTDTMAEGAGRLMILSQKLHALTGLKKFQEAKKVSDESLKIIEDFDISKNDMAIFYANHAQFLMESSNYKNAENQYLKAFELNNSLNDFSNASANLINLGLLYDSHYKDFDKAKELYENAYLLANKSNHRDRAVLSLLNLGTLYLSNDSYEAAAKICQEGIRMLLPEKKGLDHYNRNPNYADLSNAVNEQNLYLLLRNKGEVFLKKYKSNPKDEASIKLAMETFVLADRIVDQMRWNQNAQQSKLYWRNRTKDLYEMAIETTMLLDDMPQAFYFFEKSRAVLLNDKLSELGAGQYLDQEDLEKVKSLKIQLVRIENQLNSEKTEAVRNDLTRNHYELNNSYARLVKDLEAKYPQYYQYKFDTALITLSEFKTKVLQADQSFVSFFNGDSTRYAFVATNDTAYMKSFSNNTFKEREMGLLDLVSNKSRLNQDYKTYVANANQLYIDLFKPLKISSKRVIVSPDGEFVPYELLLVDPSDKTSFLLREHAFSYTYSAGFLTKNGTDTKRKSNPAVLGMAPVAYDAKLQQASLIGSDISLGTLKSFFPNFRIFAKEEATKQNFLDNLGDYSVVQLYSHAKANNTDSEPEIYFYDETLKLSELQLLGKLPTELIVLSACNTGVGQHIIGEGVFSLARGFAAAGIPASITTLWQVENKATYRMTELFYKYLSESNPTDVALQKAKLAMLSSSTGDLQSLPYFWAGNVLIGKAEIFAPKKGFHGLFVLLLIFIVGTVAVILITQKKKWKVGKTV